LSAWAGASAAADDRGDWLSLTGEVRARYETLDGQFRGGGSGSDQVWAVRSLLRARADAGPVSFGVELQDSRAYADDAGTALSTSLVNPLDILQVYVRLAPEGLPGFEDATLTLGRQTLGIGSHRVLERTDFGNVIFSYTGATFRGVTADGDQLYLLAFVPVGREPGDRAALDENALSADEEQWGRRAWGVHWRDLDFGGREGLLAEAYLYGLHEEDQAGVASPNRDYLQPGLRLMHPPAAGAVDFDIEASWRTGTRRATSKPADQRDLRVEAGLLYAHIGYTFDHPWRPRLALNYYWAGGDSDPNDSRFEQFERLFGARRSDLGATSLFGPLSPANLSAPGARLEITPSSRFDARLAYKTAFLDEPRDAWVEARLVDPTGASGDFIGHSFDARARYWVRPGALRLEVGGGALLPGGFAEQIPGGPRPDRSLFGYLQLTHSF
jgi:hypothetical protein